MEQQQSRRNFLENMLYGAAALGISGCAHRDALKGTASVQETYSNIDAAIEGANEFADSHKADLQLSHEELATAARQYQALGELAKNYDGKDKSDKVKASNEARQKLLGIIKYGLANGEGYVGIEINGFKQRGSGIKTESWAYKTNVTSQTLANLLDYGKDDGLFTKDEVISMVANARSSYQTFPEHALDVSEVTKRGYHVLEAGQTSRIEQLLCDSEFAPVVEGKLPYTTKNHAIMSGNDYVQGAYNQKMPAALQLVMTKLPGYKVVQE